MNKIIGQQSNGHIQEIVIVGKQNRTELIINFWGTNAVILGDNQSKGHKISHNRKVREICTYVKGKNQTTLRGLVEVCANTTESIQSD